MTEATELVPATDLRAGDLIYGGRQHGPEIFFTVDRTRVGTEWVEVWTDGGTEGVADVYRVGDQACIRRRGCSWCRECGSCDYGLAMSCTCGDCDCRERCGHPRCARGWTPPGEPVCTTCGGRGSLLTASGPDGDLIDEEPCPDCPPLPEPTEEGSQS